MQVHSVDSCSFGTKNTFLRKAKKATDFNDKSYYKSLHYEAKSRLHYIKFQKANKELVKHNSKTSFSYFKTFLKMTKEKIQSAICESKSFCNCPSRYFAADDFYAQPERHYIVKPFKD